MPGNKNYNCSLMEAEIDEIVNLFYRQQEDEGFTALNKLWDKLEEIIIVLSSINLPDERSKAISEINDLLARLLTAIEKKDIIIITDILKYEFINYLRNLEN